MVAMELVACRSAVRESEKRISGAKKSAQYFMLLL
jgi:hypothetical protein